MITCLMKCCAKSWVDLAYWSTLSSMPFPLEESTPFETHKENFEYQINYFCTLYIYDHIKIIIEILLTYLLWNNVCPNVSNCSDDQYRYTNDVSHDDFYLSSRQEWKTTKSTVSQMRLKPRLSNTKLTRVFDVEIMQYEINKNS